MLHSSQIVFVCEGVGWGYLGASFKNEVRLNKVTYLKTTACLWNSDKILWNKHNIYNGTVRYGFSKTNTEK